MKIRDSWEGHMCSLNYLKALGSNLEVLFYLNQHSLIVYTCLHFISDLMIKYQLSKNGNNNMCNNMCKVCMQKYVSTFQVMI